MKAGLVRNLGFGLLTAGAFALGACNDNPTNFDPQTTQRLLVNPSLLVVTAADTAELSVKAVNEGAEPSFATVSAMADQCGGGGAITVVGDPKQTSLESPGRLLVLGGSTIGTACVVATAGGVTDTADVIVVPSDIIVTSAPSLLRAGQTGTVTTSIVDLTGAAVGPFSSTTDVAYSSDNSASVAVDGATGDLTTTTAGSATITSTWSGTAATGTTGVISRSVDQTITVDPNVPASAAIDTADLDQTALPALSFGAFGAGVTDTAEIVVSDALGNQNRFPNEVTGATAVSSDPTVVTVTTTIDSTTDALTGVVTVNLSLIGTSVGAGSATISGTAETTSGSLPWGPVAVTVLAPVISGVAPAAGAPGTAGVVITGAGFSAAGFTTELLVGGLKVANFTVDSPTQITAEMPTLDVAGAQPVIVDVGGVQSTAAIWTQTGAFSEAATEPANESSGTSPSVAATLSFAGSFDGGADLDDFFRFTLNAATNLVIDMAWPTAEDLDILVVDVGFTAFECTDGATGANPEQSLCSLPAGGHQLWLDDFSGGASTYTVSMQAQ